MDPMFSSGRSRRPVTKPRAFSPEPAAPPKKGKRKTECSGSRTNKQKRISFTEKPKKIALQIPPSTSGVLSVDAGSFRVDDKTEMVASPVPGGGIKLKIGKKSTFGPITPSPISIDEAPAPVAPVLNPVAQISKPVPPVPQPVERTPKPEVPKPTPSSSAVVSRNSIADLPPGLANVLDRPNRHKSKNVFELAPSLVPKDIRRSIQKVPQTVPATLPSTNVFQYPSVQPSTPSPLIRSRGPIVPSSTVRTYASVIASSSSYRPRAPPIIAAPHLPPTSYGTRGRGAPSIRRASKRGRGNIGSRATTTTKQSQSIENNVDANEPEPVGIRTIGDVDLIDFGNDSIAYLRRSHPAIERSLQPLEKNYEDTYFLREMFMEYNDDNVDENVDESIINVTSDMPTLLPRPVNYNGPIVLHAKKIALALASRRLSMTEAEKEAQAMIVGGNKRGRCILHLLEVIKNQYLMEAVYSTQKNGIIGYHVQSIQNASDLRCKLFKNFVIELAEAHEWILKNLADGYLVCYLNLLRYLNTVGTTAGQNLMRQDSNHEFDTVRHLLETCFKSKVRDPYSKMILQFDRKLKYNDVYVLLIYPGIAMKDQISNPVYHAHEQIFLGLVNMGAGIEKIEISDTWDFKSSPNIIQVCDFAVEFLRKKISEVVARRPNDRIFLAAWGVSCLFVHEAALDVSGLSGIIDFGMPTKSPLGYRGEVGDKILYTYCPTLVVVGERAENSDIGKVAKMLKRFVARTGLVVIGGADSSLIMPVERLVKYGMTLSSMGRLIMEHVMDFVEKVYEDMHPKYHTKKVDIPDPYLVTTLTFEEYTLLKGDYGFHSAVKLKTKDEVLEELLRKQAETDAKNATKPVTKSDLNEAGSAEPDSAPQFLDYYDEGSPAVHSQEPPPENSFKPEDEAEATAESDTDEMLREEEAAARAILEEMGDEDHMFSF